MTLVSVVSAIVLLGEQDSKVEEGHLKAVVETVATK